MSGPATNLSAVAGTQIVIRGRLAIPLLIAIFVLLWALTGPHFMADTSVYTSAILAHQHGLPPDDYHRLTANPYWEFGHLLWRPLGWLCFVLVKPVVVLFAPRNEVAQVIVTLMGLDFLAALFAVLFFFLLARKVLEEGWPAALATVALICSDAFLNYSHTGNAYLVGLACLIAGMFLSVSGEAGSMGRACFAGIALALAVLFWFPYIFVLPAAFGAPLLLYGLNGQRSRISAMVGTCAAVGLVGYGLGTVCAGVHSFADLRAWIMAASHGQMSQEGLRAITRMAFSLPRSFLNMGRDGMLVKRYLVHHPYASVTLAGLLRLSLWKVVLFYVTAGVVILQLLRSPLGRALLLLLLTALIPILVFSLVLFESGSIERYLPLYPFVFLAWGYAIATSKARFIPRFVLLTALIAVVIVNVQAMRRSTLETDRMAALDRIRDLVPRLTPNSLVMAVSGQDSLALFQHNFPLDPLNLGGTLVSYDVIETGATRLATWREDFAARVLWTWGRGGSVWLPMRFLSASPDPKWNWVEGDDRRVRWSDLPAFFSQFRVGANVGGNDGFVELLNVPENRTIVQRIAHQPRAQSAIVATQVSELIAP
jgi:hypothetical protein